MTIDVVGRPSNSSVPPLEFGHNNIHISVRPGDEPVTQMGGDWVVMNVTLPEQGLEALDFRFTVPLSFDDLSAAVVMDLVPGQDLAREPPAPAGSICRCACKLARG